MRSRPYRALVLPLLLTASVAQAQGHVTTPKQHFGHAIGDDYWLPNYDQYESYLKTIARESNRAKLVEIGKTAEGRTQYTLIVSAPENIKNLEHYRQIEQRLARAEGLTDAQAHPLADEGKAVVWIDGGLHATEVLGANQLIQTEYDLLTRTDPETMRILRDDIVLLTNVNPDGMQLVANWYMQEPDSLKRNENIPRLYEKYAGHDDNRDFYMANLPETQNEEKVMFWEWYPIIVYNHHQTGPAGTVMFTPPFRDPFNYVYDPLLVMDIDMVGSAIHTRFAAEGKPGFTMRSGSSYSTWWDGGLRTSVYFHNMIGLLTETIGNPDTDTHPVRAGRAVAARRSTVPRRAAGVALQAVHRLHGERELCGARHRVATPRRIPVRPVSDGAELDRQRQPRQLDRDADDDRGRGLGRGA